LKPPVAKLSFERCVVVKRSSQTTTPRSLEYVTIRRGSGTAPTPTPPVDEPEKPEEPQEAKEEAQPGPVTPQRNLQ
jgi:hypothetical protein